MSSRQDILDAATRLFADKGYEAAAVREICHAAGANVAAINYHFGGKAALYHEVVRRAYEATSSSPMPTLAAFEEPEVALGAWIEWYVDRGTSPSEDPARRLLLREAAQPTAELDGLVQSVLHPVYRGLKEIVTTLLPPTACLRTRKIHCLSILGQCLVHRVCREMIDRLPVDPPLGPQDAPAIANIVTRNAVASLAAAHHAPSPEPTP
ncbi:MAG: CerR family C-terminal domain-containing protein [Planctomycetota bacterium]|nr:CerR family C-terminal domain-containing protein [Planctomycetota bacterium]